MTTPAGWYPDPDGSGGQRYFDGQSWTDHPRPAGPNGKVVAGIIAAVVVLIVVAAAGVYLTLRADVGEPTVTHKPSDAAAQNSVVASEPAADAPTLENQARSMGQPVRDGNFQFVVKGVERAPSVADAQFPDLKKAAEGEYLLVKMTVTNVGTEPQTFFASFNTLSDGSTEYHSDDEAWIYLGNTLADLNPGDSIDTALVFDVPVGTEAESIELHGGPISEGVTVGL